MTPSGPGTQKKTIYGVLAGRAVSSPDQSAVLTWSEGAVREDISWSRLLEAVNLAYDGLAANEVGAGDRVMVSLPNGPGFIVTVVACIAAGAIAVPAPVPLMRRSDAYRARLSAMAGDCDPRLVITNAEWTGDTRLALRELRPSPRVLSLEDLSATAAPGTGAPGTAAPGAVAAPPGGIAFLQYTSGSTARPRGVAITHQVLAAQCAQAAAAYSESPDDTAVTWVPLFHDMGLITGVMRPLHSGYRTVLLPTADFVRSPRAWLAALDQCGGTLSSAPNFAYDLCVRKLTQRDVAGLDLSKWRVARNAGEVVRAETLDGFARLTAAAGFRRTALCPSYGLAEATLTVTTCSPGTEWLRLTVDAAELERGRVVDAGREQGGRRVSQLASSGVPVPGTRILIGDGAIGDGDIGDGGIGDGEVGEIRIRGPQISPGYWPVPEAAPASSGELRTGDVGFVRDGHLFVLGRIDDTIVLHGRKFFMADICSACDRVPGLRPGRLAAFLDDSEPGQEPSVRVVAEVRSGETLTDDKRKSGLAREVTRILSQQIGLFVRTVDLVDYGTLPVTTSGKVQVSAARRMVLSRTGSDANVETG